MDTTSFSDFESSGRAVLAFLHRRLGFDLWMVTRTEGDHWLALQSQGTGAALVPLGSTLHWSESLSAKMANAKGPFFAPKLEGAPAHFDGPIGRVHIRACIGQPLFHENTSLFGSLCAVDPAPQSESIVNESDLIELLGNLLSKILQAELRVAEQTRLAEKLQAEALTDALTSLYNLRGWDRLLDAEEQRCRRYGHPAAVLYVDLDGLKAVNDSQGHAAGDQLLARTAQALRGAARSLDVVARLGGDEFAILSAECDEAGAAALAQRVRVALASANIGASIGMAMRDPRSGLRGACKTADRRMYAEKRSRTRDVRPYAVDTTRAQIAW